MAHPRALLDVPLGYSNTLADYARTRCTRDVTQKKLGTYVYLPPRVVNAYCARTADELGAHMALAA